MLDPAGHDSLTGLPDRMLLRDRLGQAIALCRRRHGLLALIRIDLEGLEDSDNALGDRALGDGGGDRVLQAVASRLSADLRASDTFARINSDAFALIVAELSAQDAATRVAGKILATFDAGFVVDGHTVRPRARLGIAVFPANGQSAEQLLRNAGIAAAHARAAGVRMHRFDGKVDHTLPDDLARDLAQAIELEQLSLQYQPQIELGRQRLVGLEALLRWHHPTRGEIEPEVFVELAETSGQIGRIGKWALAEACAAAATWPIERLGPIRVAVNFSTAQMAGDDLPQMVARALERSGLPAKRLELEITERSVLDGGERVRAALRRLRTMGVRLALDDFGTGYASLRHLDGLPLDALKIDRSFVANLASGANHAIVQCVIELAHRLELRVTAEGVENEAQLAILRDLGCDDVQGHVFGKPMPAANVASWLLGRADSQA